MLLCGCAKQNYKPTDEVMPPEFTSAEQAATADKLCAPLATGAASGLLQRVSQQNLQLQAAAARVRGALAEAAQSDAGRWPSLQLNSEASRGKMPPLSQQGLQGGGGEQVPALPGDSALIYNQFRVSLAAEYELDLWSRLDNLADAARLQAQAQQSDAYGMAVSLSAQLLEAWFDLNFAQQQQSLLEDQTATAQRMLDLLKLRFQQGQTSALDAVQQKQQLEALAASLAQNRAQVQLAHHQLALLLGEEPDTDDVDLLAQPLPEQTPWRDEVDVSAAFLARRPDLHGAFYRLQAADAQHAAAVAERLPSVRLTASLFDQNREAEALGDNLLWRIAAAITQPLFTAGRIDAQIDAAQAQLDEALLGYRQALLTALRELADAWTSEQQAALRSAHLREQQSLARDAYQLVNQQYQRGSADFLRVLDAQQSLTNVEQELLRSERQHLSYRVQFCRALGVHWLGEDSPLTEAPL